jgi:2-C-methyl-D-erythritol 4-phosphate cytidylyltransferase
MVVTAIIPVAGQGKRFGGPVPKQFQTIEDEPVISITVSKFASMPNIDFGVVVVAKNDIDKTRRLLSKIDGFAEKFKIVAGGAKRQDSVYQGLLQVPSNTDIVLVHDGVRPLIIPKMINASVESAAQSGACVLAVPVKETIKRVIDHQVCETLQREELWQIQTPQTFRYRILYEAHEKAHQSQYYSTDEAALVEWCGYPVKVLMGDYTNIKITTEEDLEMARVYYKGRKM